MNNKGFAITGILYTIFILFIMTLLAILSGLNTRLKIMQKSIMSFDDDYVQVNNVITSSGENLAFRQNALYTGKYVFQSITDSNKVCISYIRRGKVFKTISFINDDTNCKDLYSKNQLALKAIYKFS